MVAPRADEDAADAVQWLMLLRNEFTELDDVVVEPVRGPAPAEAKGVGDVTALLAGVPAAAVAAVFQFLRAWVVRTDRTVEVSIDGDTFKVTGVNQEQQDRMIDAWLARHAPRA
jgi:hypothetical protein